MKKKALFLFKSFVGGWIMYLPWYLLQAFSLWIGVYLLNMSDTITYRNLLGFVIILRILRGLITKAGNVVTTEIMKEQIAKDAWDQALRNVPGETDQPLSDAEFRTWYRAYRKTVTE
jgi:hypothetical protein